MLALKLAPAHARIQTIAARADNWGREGPCLADITCQAQGSAGPAENVSTTMPSYCLRPYSVMKHCYAPWNSIAMGHLRNTPRHYLTPATPATVPLPHGQGMAWPLECSWCQSREWELTEPARRAAEHHTRLNGGTYSMMFVCACLLHSLMAPAFTPGRQPTSCVLLDALTPDPHDQPTVCVPCSMRLATASNRCQVTDQPVSTPGVVTCQTWWAGSPGS
jgi:hypothetical protein